MKLFGSVGDYFALDIGTTAVRAVQLSGTEGNWSLTHYGTIPIDHSYGSTDEEERASLRNAITAVIGQSGIRAKRVVLGLPSNKVFTSVVDMPDMSSKDLARALERQMQQYSADTDEVSVDWAVLGRSTNDPTKNEVLLASVAKTLIASQVDLVKELGFSVAAVEPNTLALTRALMPAKLDDGSLIVEIGDAATDIVVAYQGAPRSLCTLPIGIQTLIGAVSRSLKVESVQATQFIMKFGMQPDKLEGHVRISLEPLVTKLIDEALKSINLFQARYPGVRVSQAIISGYGTSIPRFGEYITQKTGIPAEPGNPWQNINISGKDRAQLQALSSQFSVVVGLAQRGGGS